MQAGDAKQVGFIMLTSNLSLVQQELDHVRADPPKFLCLNDNFNDSLSNSQQQMVCTIAPFSSDPSFDPAHSQAPIVQK